MAPISRALYALVRQRSNSTLDDTDHDRHEPGPVRSTAVFVHDHQTNAAELANGEMRNGYGERTNVASLLERLTYCISFCALIGPTDRSFESVALSHNNQLLKP
jgi:hypothetical protein